VDEDKHRFKWSKILSKIEKDGRSAKPKEMWGKGKKVKKREKNRGKINFGGLDNQRIEIRRECGGY
jgi:hypothetical protein